MDIRNIAFTILCICGLTSCHTALHVNKIDLQRPLKQAPNMEFIGFQNMNRNNILLRDFAVELERCNIAVNRQGFYMGTFNLQELANYKSQQRYITFLDVVRQTYSHSDAVHDNNGLEVGGWVIAAITAFTLVPVYVPMLCAADKNDCQINLAAEYRLMVYDTQLKEIVMNAPIQIAEQDLLIGQYSHKETNRKEVDEHYKTILYNMLLAQYAQAYNYVNTLPK